MTVAVLVVGVAVVLIVGPRLPGLALRAAGFTELGSADQVFANLPVQPDIVLNHTAAAPDASLNLGSLGVQPVSAVGANAVVGESSIGRAAAVTLTEANLMDLCRQRSTVCAGGNDQFRNARIDLRPGGAVVYGDVYIPDVGLWQSLGVVVQVDASGRQIQVMGVEVGGQLYGLPAGTISKRVNDLLTQVNATLTQASMDAAGGQYALFSIQVTDDALTVVLR
jgi:hypothetical protein